MSTTPSFSPSTLQPLLPFRDTFGAQWQPILSGLAAAPDPALAAVNLSRLTEHSPATVLDTPHAWADLLFVLGASQYLANVLLHQGPRWDAVFLTDRHATGKNVATHLAHLHTQFPLDLAEENFRSGLHAYRNREYLRIGIRDLLALATVEDTTLDLSHLAEAAVQMAYEYARAQLRVAYGEAVLAEGQRPLGFVVFGMGKLGGKELNFSSDIDLIYLYERDAGSTTGGSKGTTEPRAFFTQLAQRLGHALTDLISGGRVFRVDVGLRPDGMNGPLVNSLANTVLYYESWGQTWERAALLKARPIAGDHALGEDFLREIEPFVFRRYLDYSTVEDLNDMKARVEQSLSRDERAGGNVKLGRGGIREIEFVVQALQLIHAGKHQRVRARATLTALERLTEEHLLSLTDRDTLRDAYCFLRHVEHKLQIVHDRQTHSLPDDDADIRALARRLRLRDTETRRHGDTEIRRYGDTEIEQHSPRPPLTASPHRNDPQAPVDEVALFRSTLRTHTEAVRQIFRSLFQASQAADPRDAEIAALLQELRYEERTLWRLQKLGFHRLTESYQHLQLLRDGPPHSPATPKRRKMLYALAPLLFREVSRAADPDRALAAMASLIASIGARSSFLSLLKENPAILRTLVGLFGTSEYLTQIFLRRPALLDSLVRADLVRVHKDRDTMQGELDTSLAGAETFEDQLDTLRRYRTEEFLRIGINDSNGLLDFTATSAQLTALAETCLAGACHIAQTALLQHLGRAALPGHLAIVGMGKLGAGELNYNSDLDLIFLYEADQAEEVADGLGAHEVFTKLAQRLLSILQVQTGEGYVYKIDTRLRPSGRSGALVSSLAAFARYHHTSSQLWERQALIKARVVAGDPTFAPRIAELVEGVVYSNDIDAAGVAEIDHLRARMEHELAREAANHFNIKTGRGGIVDIEFLVQMLQLRYGSRFPAVRQRATLPALQALRACAVMPEEDWGVLTAGYRFLRKLENRLRIEHDQPVEALTGSGAQLVALARRLGYEGEGAAAQLLADYQRQRETIRTYYERWFAREQGADA